MFSDSYERRLLQQCSPVSRKQSVLVRPEPMDRFVPCRIEQNWQTNFQAIRRGSENQPAKKARGDGGGNETGGSRDHLAYGCLLRNELLGAQIEELRGPPANCADGNRAALGAVQLASAAKAAVAYSPPVFRFRAPAHSAEENIDPSPYSLSPVSAKSQKLLRSPRKATRKISRIPFKVLDAPELQDDFYLNLVDWSAQNVLSVGLGSCVYLWSACTSQVTRLCDLSSEGNAVTSVAWSERGHLVAVGTQKGHISVWDVAVNKEVTKLQGHIARVGALAWNGDILSSGSRDRHIRQRDTRTPPVQSSRILQGHRQEVCGLKWSPDGQSLASGGNDNKLFVWSMHSTSPVQTYSSHVAAVKAIAWSPHQHGLLASGGGTADRCIRFWNTLTSQPMQCVDTGSQVCNLAWSKHSSELVSTHGYSQNQILVWKYPSLTQVRTFCTFIYQFLITKNKEPFQSPSSQTGGLISK
ncbi:fizzy-related protein homolog [Hyposmocoma kahamanoa]|uniref:fizzy-related protein homolog n=1 Tax=Hyposmocoma kahamanoa TaxID=1477025 RepID=UPI000E6D62FF|nr:fizzy-related protein homolog [Hyposmocoma kahamanoa]